MAGARLIDVHNSYETKSGLRPRRLGWARRGRGAHHTYDSQLLAGCDGAGNPTRAALVGETAGDREDGVRRRTREEGKGRGGLARHGPPRWKAPYGLRQISAASPSGPVLAGLLIPSGGLARGSAGSTGLCFRTSLLFSLSLS